MFPLMSTDTFFHRYPSGFVVCRPFRGTPGNHARNRRGRVHGFSFGSSKRLRQRLVQSDYSTASAVTLTAPSALPWKLWHKVIYQASHTGVPFVWRKEVTKKGAIHLHIIVFDSSRVSDLLFAYEKVLGNDSIYGFHERQISGALDAIRYLCSHTSKHKWYQSLTVGRAWGFCNAQSYRLLPMIYQTVTWNTPCVGRYTVFADYPFHLCFKLDPFLDSFPRTTTPNLLTRYAS